MDSNLNNGSVLNSWKEIAQHVGRGIRTVQRWERDLGMPVRRPRRKSRSAVIAIAAEIDAWLRAAPTGEAGARHAENTGTSVAALHAAITDLLLLRTRIDELRAANERELAKLNQSLRALRRLVADSQGLKAQLHRDVRNGWTTRSFVSSVALSGHTPLTASAARRQVSGHPPSHTST